MASLKSTTPPWPKSIHLTPIKDTISDGVPIKRNAAVLIRAKK